MRDEEWLAARFEENRARRRVRGEPPRAAGAVGQETNPLRQRAVTEAFLAASRAGNHTALLAVLDPDVMLHEDQAVRPPGYPATLHGAAVSTSSPTPPASKPWS